MSHKPYEDFIFSDQDLTPEQSRRLHEHLKHCDQCYQLSKSRQEVDTILADSVVAAPQPGFVTRWQTRLSDEQEKRKNRQNLRMMIFTWGSAVALLAIILLISWPILQDPKIFFFTSLYQLLNLVSLASTLKNISTGLMDGLSGVFPWILIVITAGVLTQLGVFWIVSFRMLTKPRRVNS